MSRALYLLYLCVVTLFGVLCFDYIYSNTYIDSKIGTQTDVELDYRVPNDIFYYSLKPNYAGHGSSGGRLYPLYTNSLGFRDAQVREVELTPDKERIVLIGDSFTEGVGLAWEDTFAGMVAKERGDLEILNAGVASYSPRIYFRKMEWLLGMGYDVDHVIVYMDISDIHDEALRSRKPQPAKEARVVDSAAGGEDAQPPHSGLLRRLWESQRDNFFLVRSGMRAGRKLVARLYAGIGGDPSGFLPRPYSLGMPRASWTIEVTEEAFHPLGFSDTLALTIDWMDQLHDLLRRNDIPLSVAVYPWPNQIDAGDLDSRHVEIWETWCRTRCEEFLNLFPDMFDQADAAGHLWYDALFIEGDIHYNARGNHVLARGTLDMLARVSGRE